MYIEPRKGSQEGLVANKIDLRQPCTIFLRILGLRAALAGGLHGHQMDRQALKLDFERGPTFLATRKFPGEQNDRTQDSRAPRTGRAAL
jgi:hypothetical protein